MSTLRNGSKALFYVLVAVCVLLPVAALVFYYVRASDIETITKTKQDTFAVKKAFDEKVVGRTPEGFHRYDMKEWCEAAMKVNRGFVCPDPYTLHGFKNPR